jgi:hypothetical protein
MDREHTQYELWQELDPGDPARGAEPTKVLLRTSERDTPTLRTEAAQLAVRACGLIQLWRVTWGWREEVPYQHQTCCLAWPGRGTAILAGGSR